MHHRPAAPASSHGEGGSDRRAQVRVHDLVEPGPIEPGQRFDRVGAGVVDEHVHRPHLGLDRDEPGRERGLVEQVHAERDGPAAGGPHRFDRGLRVVGPPGVHDHGGARFGEALAQPLAEAAAGAGDEDHRRREVEDAADGQRRRGHEPGEAHSASRCTVSGENAGRHTAT